MQFLETIRMWIFWIILYFIFGESVFVDYAHWYFLDLKIQHLFIWEQCRVLNPRYGTISPGNLPIYVWLFYTVYLVGFIASKEPHAVKTVIWIREVASDTHWGAITDPSLCNCGWRFHVDHCDKRVSCRSPWSHLLTSLSINSTRL